MDRMPGEEQSRSEGGQRGKPTHEDDSQQHCCEAVPQGVHDVKPSGAAIRDGPIHGIAQNRKWSIQARTRAAWPVWIVERGKRRRNRMGRGIRHDDGAIVLYKPVTGGWQVQRERRDEYEKQLALHGSRARRESATLEDRKSTRLNSSHGYISYAVFCLKKKIKVFSPEEPQTQT